MTTSLDKIRGAGIYVVSHTFPTLTTPTSGTTAPFGPVDFIKNHTFQWKAGTAGSAVFVRAEGSLDRENWFDMFASGSAQISNILGTATPFNITKQLNKPNFKTKYVRFNYYAITSVAGTAHVDVKYFGGI